MKSCFDEHTKFRQFAPGDQVLARDFTSPEKWQPGEVLRQKAPHSYSVQLKDEECGPVMLTTLSAAFLIHSLERASHNRAW